VDREAVAILDLDGDVEGGRGLALQHGFLRAPPLGFLIGERHALDAADEVVERWVHHQVLDGVAVRGADQLDAALGDGARGQRLLLGRDLVDDDDFGHVVLHRFDHH
jgi:hypothetical protein